MTIAYAAIALIFSGVILPFSVAAVEIPPKPIDAIAPPYPKEAAAGGKEGWVYLNLHITAEDNVSYRRR